jgi:hypothetical protein
MPMAVNLAACDCWKRCAEDCPCECHKRFDAWMDSINPKRLEMANDVAEAARIVGLTALSDFGPVTDLARRLVQHADRLRKEPPCACDPATNTRCLSHAYTQAIA